MNSQLFKLNWRDAIIGLLMAVIGAILAAVLQSIQNGGLDAINWQNTLSVGIVAAISYLLKNFFSDDSGKVLGKI